MVYHQISFQWPCMIFIGGSPFSYSPIWICLNLGMCPNLRLFDYIDDTPSIYRGPIFWDRQWICKGHSYTVLGFPFSSKPSPTVWVVFSMGSRKLIWSYSVYSTFDLTNNNIHIYIYIYTYIEIDITHICIMCMYVWYVLVCIYRWWKCNLHNLYDKYSLLQYIYQWAGRFRESLSDILDDPQGC